MSNSLQPHGLYSPRNSPGQNTEMGSLPLSQGIFATQGSNPGLPCCRWMFHHLSHQGNPSRTRPGTKEECENCVKETVWQPNQYLLIQFNHHIAYFTLFKHHLFHFWNSFSSVAQSCPNVCDLMDCSTPGLPVHHQLPESTQNQVHRVGDAIQPSHPLSSPSPPAFNRSQHRGFFRWVSSSHEVAKVLEFQLQHQCFQWTPRTDLL